MRSWSLAILAGLAIGLMAGGGSVAAPPAPPVASPAAAQGAAWFTDARFGMFVHWGLYSQSGGEWRGQRFYGITEWLMKRAKIPQRDYATLAADFNPQAFDAKAWVAAAKSAGVKYIVITAKHHDGFAMFEFKATDYDIVDATRFKRDPLLELANAARAEGIGIGFYYSQFQDWADPDAGGNDWDYPAEGRNFRRYLDRKAIPQLKELLTRYGPVSLIWFDTPQQISPEDSRELYDLVKSLQPNALVSSRVGNGLGDFVTYGDAEIPAQASDARAWEAIFTHNDSWGFSKFDKNFKSTTELVRLLATVASKGGNLLLNVGPDGAGRMPQESVVGLAGVGDWLKIHGESIYGTRGGGVGEMPWGVVTQRPGRFYLHVFQRPADGRLVLPIAALAPRSAKFLGGVRLNWRREGENLVVFLPQALPDQKDSVVVVEHAGTTISAPSSQDDAFLSRQFASFALSPADADMSGGAAHKAVHYYHYFGDWKHFETVDGLKDPGSAITWNVRVLEPGDYHIDLEYAAGAASAGREGVVDVAEQAFRFQVLETGDVVESNPAPLVQHPIGVVRFLRPGSYRLAIRAEGRGENLFTLREVILRPVD